MIGLDTNVLARYYIQDEGDEEAARQHEAARRLVESGRPLMVCKTVVLEFEWVMRGYYGFNAMEVAGVLRHLLGLPQVTSMTQFNRTLLMGIKGMKPAPEGAESGMRSTWAVCG